VRDFQTTAGQAILIPLPRIPAWSEYRRPPRPDRLRQRDLRQDLVYSRHSGGYPLNRRGSFSVAGAVETGFALLMTICRRGNRLAANLVPARVEQWQRRNSAPGGWIDPPGCCVRMQAIRTDHRTPPAMAQDCRPLTRQCAACRYARRPV